MRRVISVWFPTLPTDRRRLPERNEEFAVSCDPASHGSKGQGPWRGQGQRPGLPTVTITNRLLTAVDATAAALGLRPGMKLAQAQALVPGLAVHDDDPAGDAAVLTRLAEECLRYAPLAAPDPLDGLWIDITGTTHLHGGEARLLRDLLRRLHGQGFNAFAAVADTPAVAHAVARFGGGGVVPPNTAADGGSGVPPPNTAVIADFPVEALRLPAPMLADLRLMGFDQVGPLAAAARAPLVRRFGPLLAARLDQAAGTLFEPIVPLVPPTLIQARLAFVEPLLTPQAFSSVIARLVQTVCADLERAGQGARRLDLLFERVDGPVQAIRIGTTRPVRDAHHLARMMNERLEHVDPGLGVEAMRLVVAAADPLGFVQTVSSLVGEAPADIATLVDHLVNRLGEARIYRIAPGTKRCPRTLGLPLASPLAHPRIPSPPVPWQPVAHHRRLAGRSATSGAAARSATAHRCNGVAAGSSAGRVHLAARASPGAPCRRSGTHRRGVVEARPGMGLGARLFPRRGRARPPLLAVPPRQRQRPRHRRHAMVPARGFLTGANKNHKPRSAPHGQPVYYLQRTICH